jgi:hypothetical protein
MISMVSFSFYGDLIIVVGRDHDNTEAAMVKEATELNSEGKKKKKKKKKRIKTERRRGMMHCASEQI